MRAEHGDAVEHARREPHAGEPLHRAWLAAALAAALFAILVIGFVGLPREDASLPAIARFALDIALPRWGTTEPVNEIVYGTRGFDTFAETFLLLAAVVSVTTIARGREHRAEYVGEAAAGRREQAEADPGSSERSDGPGGSGGPGRSGRPGASGRSGPRSSRQQAREAESEEESEASDAPPPDADRLPLGEPAPERAEAMTVVVRVAARIAVVPLAVAGVYLAAWGYAPGGGFPAGAVLSGVAVLLYATLGYRAIRRFVRPSVLEVVELLGAAAIIAIALVGLIREGSFTANWVPLAEPATIFGGGNIQPFSISELVEVATGLTIAIFALLGMRHDWTPDNDDDSDDEPDGQR